MATLEQNSSSPTRFPIVNAFVAQLNGRRHRQALWVFMIIVMGHWAEHLFQAVQVYVLHWPRSQANGALGMLWPWLVTSEWLHYIYAIVMLVGLIVLNPGFEGRSRRWWMIALAIQIWHHFEHLLLLSQALTHSYLFGRTVPTSILQLFFPRMELHLFYNAVVFVPYMIAMYYHLRPPAEEAPARCGCAYAAQESLALS